MQGRVDLKFRIHGDREAGTLYFTSIRPKQEGAWRIGMLDECFFVAGSVLMVSEVQGYH
jgi:hypothetical protein